MSNEVDYPQQWRSYLSYGYRDFSTQLLTPGIGLIVSPDGKKILVIGEDTTHARFDYDDEEQLFYVNLCNGGVGTIFECPGCKQPYRISPEKREHLDKELIYILKGTPVFDCACGVMFTFYERYVGINLLFHISELVPLYIAGMSRAADLFVRYTLSADNRTLIEEVGVVSQMPNAISLTESPSFKFSNWSNRTGPSFILETYGGSFLAYDVQIWRTRTYTLGSEMFEEKTRPSFDGGTWKRVFREVRSLPDDYINQKMLSLLTTSSKAIASSNPQSESELQKRPKRGKGRPKGTGWFKDEKQFETALKEVLQNSQKRPSQLRMLIKLDAHKLCRVQPKKPRTQSDTKLLRIWLELAGLRNFDHAIETFSPSLTIGK